MRGQRQNAYSLNCWQENLQDLRKYLRGWNLKNIGDMKNIKIDLSNRISEIDLIAESRLLSMEEWEERIELERKIEDMIRLEETQWKQRAGKNWILQGDPNTHFFHQYANGRRRKRAISFLDSGEGEIRGQKEITSRIVNFYKQLFGPNVPCNLSLSSNFWPDNLKLNCEERDSLIKPFSTEEIKEIVMNMKENSAPGPNGFSGTFFKKFWNVIKGNLERMFNDFWWGQLDIKRLKFGVPSNIDPFVSLMWISNASQRFLPIGWSQ